MKMGKYLLLSTVILGLVDPLVGFANENNVPNSKMNNEISQKNVNTETDKKDDQNINNQNAVAKTGVDVVKSAKKSLVAQEITWGNATLTLDDNGVLTVPEGARPSTGADYLSTSLKQAGVLDEVKILNIAGKVDFSNTFGRADTLTRGLSNVTKIVGLNKVDYSNINTFSGIFSGDVNLTDVDFNGVNSSNVTDMDNMFSGTAKLTHVDLSPLDTSKIISMHNMFGDSGIQTLDLSKNDLSNVEDMGYMFNDSGLESFDFTGMSLPKLKNIIYLFGGSKNLRNVNIGDGFNANNIETAGYVFEGTAIKSLDVSKLNTAKVRTLDHTFSNMSQLTELKLGNMNTSNVKSMTYMFAYDTNLTNLDLSSFDTSNTEVSDAGYEGMMYMFAYMNKLTNLKLGDKFVFKKDQNANAGLDYGHEVKGNYSNEYSWHSQGTNSLSKDEHKWSSDELMNNFDGSKDSDTYVWQPNAVKAADVTVKYVDENGKQIESDAILTGNVGDAYKADEKTIPGYIFAEAKDGNENGKFTDKSQTVTMIYKKLKNNTPVMPVQDGTLTVKYVDEDGNDIVDPIVTKEKAGTAYKTEKKDIEGYVFKEVKGNETGKYVAGNQTVTYVYTKNENHNVTPTDPNKPDTPNDSGQTNQPENNNTGKDTGSSDGNVVNNVVNGIQSALPKTAAEKTTLAGVISVVLASLAGLVFWNRRK